VLVTHSNAIVIFTRVALLNTPNPTPHPPNPSRSY